MRCSRVRFLELLGVTGPPGACIWKIKSKRSGAPFISTPHADPSISDRVSIMISKLRVQTTVRRSDTTTSTVHTRDRLRKEYPRFVFYEKDMVAPMVGWMLRLPSSLLVLSPPPPAGEDAPQPSGRVGAHQPFPSIRRQGHSRQPTWCITAAPHCGASRAKV